MCGVRRTFGTRYRRRSAERRLDIGDVDRSRRRTPDASAFARRILVHDAAARRVDDVAGRFHACELAFAQDAFGLGRPGDGHGEVVRFLDELPDAARRQDRHALGRFVRVFDAGRRIARPRRGRRAAHRNNAHAETPPQVGEPPPDVAEPEDPQRLAVDGRAASADSRRRPAMRRAALMAVAASNRCASRRIIAITYSAMLLAAMPPAVVTVISGRSQAGLDRNVLTPEEAT